ncbi:uncharacterized protein CIMG_12225, partial [Coccidioides immitis RS]
MLPCQAKKRQKMDDGTKTMSQALALGYDIIQRKNGESPPEERFRELEEEINRRGFGELRHSTSNFPGDRKPVDGMAARELLYHGINFADSDPFFHAAIGCSFEHAGKEGPGLVFWAKNPSQLKRFHAGARSTAFIYCSATNEELHEENGLFRIVEGSHTMMQGQVDETATTSIRLRPNEVLIMSSNLTIEYPTAGGGVGIWMMVYRPK